MGLRDPPRASESSARDSARPRRVPAHPVDFFGRPVLERRASLSADLVHEWTQQARALARQQQANPPQQLRGARSLVRRLAPNYKLAIGAVSLVAILVAGTLVLQKPELTALLPVLISTGVAAAGISRLAASSIRQQWAKAWAAIGANDPFQAHLALQTLPGRLRSVDLVAAYLACCNRNDEAVALLQDARSLGQRTRQTTQLLIELLVRTGATARALEVVTEDRQLLTLEDLNALRRAGISLD